MEARGWMVFFDDELKGCVKADARGLALKMAMEKFPHTLKTKIDVIEIVGVPAQSSKAADAYEKTARREEDRASKEIVDVVKEMSIDEMNVLIGIMAVVFKSAAGRVSSFDATAVGELLSAASGIISRGRMQK